MASMNEFAQLFAELLSSGEYSDLTVNVGLKELKLNKLILLKTAPGLAKLMKNDSITLTDDTTDVENLVKYAYLRDFDSLSIPEATGMYEHAVNMFRYVALAAVAHKYDAMRLEIKTTAELFDRIGFLDIGNGDIYRAQPVTADSRQGKVRIFLNVARAIMLRRGDLPAMFKGWVEAWMREFGSRCRHLGEFRNGLNDYLEPIALGLRWSRNQHGTWRMRRIEERVDDARLFRSCSAKP